MAAGDPVADLSDLILLATGGGSGAPEQINFHKRSFVNGAAGGTLVAGRINSQWQYDGQPGGGSSTAPTTAVVTTNATAGALQQTVSATGTKKRLLGLTMAALNSGTVILYDRLAQQGGLSGTVTGAQTTNLPTAALTRRTTGVGVEAWLEIYTQIGTTGTTLTISYTNTVPTSGQISPAITWGNTSFREAQRIVPVPLISGQRGVRAVANINAVASTLTAGNIGVTLAYPLVVLPLPVIGTGQLWSAMLFAGGPLDLGVASDACLATAWVPQTTVATELFGHFFFVEK